ncbi:ComEC/Rec2 family competence protein [Pseudovibrio sp. Tun.PSC04-5.I4]|uniref:ComEC/Rec2 family competence protein n=1 Tax=Pseudovibrio sp. Tun.PSC04-5.I4 TaxID=1798213 RepID=UPI001AD90D13|nr:ComEC/Rec2 family competence protein [Pseudovibrio sp. Tun.PSC04-5.I4]
MFVLHPDWAAAGSYARAAFVQDWDRGQGIVWYALCHLAGVLCYFSLPAEPWGLLSVIPFIALVLLVFRARYARKAHYGLLALLFFSAGFFLADLRVEWLQTERLERPVTRKVEGVITAVKQSGNNSYSVVLRPSVGSPEKGTTRFTFLIRLSIKGMKTAPSLGDNIVLKARLLPPGGVVRPGSYDFARTAFFDGIGAVGYALSRPVVSANPEGIGFVGVIESVRISIAQRIRKVLDYSPESAFAVALLVGKRDYLSKIDKSALRQAGLAHVLAISGMHMGLVTSLVFLASRLLLSLSSTLALRGHIHAYSTLAALMAAIVYLGLSGASVATQRAFLMAVLVLCAGLLGRRALSMRGLALACLVLLSLAPEEVLAPGFQMSFIAVLALLAAYTFVKDRLKPIDGATANRNPVGFQGFLRRSSRWLVACAFTSLVAGLATAPLAAMHFEQVAPYGLLGNILAMPLVTFVVMPLGLLSLLAIPVGAEAFFLHGMEAGLQLVLKAAYWVSSLSEGQSGIGVASELGYWLIILAILGLCLLPFCLKWFAFPSFAGAVFCFLIYSAPDLIVTETGMHIAFYDADGTLRLTSSRLSFTSSSLLKAGGVPSQAFKAHKARAKDRRCDKAGCILQVFSRSVLLDEDKTTAPLMLAQSKRAESLISDCDMATIVVAQFQAPASCKAELVIDQKMLETRGSAYVWFTARGPPGHRIKKVRWAYAAQRRPWNPQVSGDVSGLIAAEERSHLALNANPARPEDASFVGGVGRFQRD